MADTPTVAATDPEFIIDEILPAHEVHLISGPSGAGKTTLLFQMVNDIKLGKPIFGFPSRIVPTAYVACDRSIASVRRTLKRLKLEELGIPCYSLISDNIEYKLDVIFNFVLSKMPDLRLLILDPVTALAPKGSLKDYTDMLQFIANITRQCERRRITILGPGHESKQRKDSEIANPREKTIGSVAWGGFSETMILLEFLNPKDQSDPTRKITICPRNSPVVSFDYAFQSGRLEPIEEYTGNFVMGVWLMNIPRGTLIPTAQMRSLAEQKGLSVRTIDRWIAKCVEEGKLEKVAHGTYRRPTQQ